MKNSILACVVLVMTVAPPLAGEQEDISLAEEMVSRAMLEIEADKKAYHRAVNALAETAAGKEWLTECPSRDTSYWTACMHDEDWKFSGVFHALYDIFHEEELKAAAE